MFTTVATSSVSPDLTDALQERSREAELLFQAALKSSDTNTEPKEQIVNHEQEMLRAEVRIVNSFLSFIHNHLSSEQCNARRNRIVDDSNQ